jgi:hypothetical protein
VNNPESLEDWQLAVDMASGYLALEASRQYALVTGGHEVNLERCLELLEEGRRQGLKPRSDAASWLICHLIAEQDHDADRANHPRPTDRPPAR